MREVLLHGSADESFDKSVATARHLAQSWGARLHIIYTVEDPLSAGWTAEMSPERLPEIHQAMESEARERLARIISIDEQERLNIQLVLRMGVEAREVVDYTKEHNIDLAIVQVRPGDDRHLDLAHALLEDSRCAVLVLR